MFGRTIAIGDIHGCSKALEALVDAISPWGEDTLITVGDHIDRGPDTAGTLEKLIRLSYRCRLIPILGNHEEMLLNILSGHQYLIGDWLAFGGDATLASYGCQLPGEIPPSHLQFLSRCRSWYESEGHFFVHASYDARLKLKKQPPQLLRWQSLEDGLPGPHRSKKVAIVGHTSQKTGEVLDLGYLRCIDTWVYGSGYLTAVDVLSGQIWQADKDGRLRR